MTGRHVQGRASSRVVYIFRRLHLCIRRRSDRYLSPSLGEQIHQDAFPVSPGEYPDYGFGFSEALLGRTFSEKQCFIIRARSQNASPIVVLVALAASTMLYRCPGPMSRPSSGDGTISGSVDLRYEEVRSDRLPSPRTMRMRQHLGSADDDS